MIAAIRRWPSESRCFIAWSAPAVWAAETAGTRSFTGDRRVDDDEPVAVVQELLELVGGLLGEDDHRAVRRAVHQPLEERHLAGVLVQGRAEDESHVLLVERLGDAGDEMREVRVVHHRHRPADQAGLAAREPRALRFAMYPRSRTTLWTSSRVSGETSPRPLTTRETVAIETPARSAISRIVTFPFAWLARQPSQRALKHVPELSGNPALKSFSALA